MKMATLFKSMHKIRGYLVQWHKFVFGSFGVIVCVSVCVVLEFMLFVEKQMTKHESNFIIFPLISQPGHRLYAEI